MDAAIEQYNRFYQGLLRRIQCIEGLAPLCIRLILIPVFWMAGTNKINFETLLPYEHTVAWFASPEWGLGLPVPALMAFLAGWTEIVGAILLTVGLAVRWISVPLMVTMLVAAITVHWEFGWQAIADPSAPFANERVIESAERLDAAKSLLKTHGDYPWLTERGSLVVLNNGIEFAAIYFVMLLSLFFGGAGRYTSMDYWLQVWLSDNKGHR